MKFQLGKFPLGLLMLLFITGIKVLGFPVISVALPAIASADIDLYASRDYDDDDDEDDDDHVFDEEDDDDYDDDDDDDYDDDDDDDDDD